MSVSNNENVTVSRLMGRFSHTFTVKFGPNFSDEGIEPADHIICRSDIEQLTP